MNRNDGYRWYLVCAVMLLAGMLIGPGGATAAIDDGLVGRYSFDGCTAVDDSGTGNNGSLVGTNQCVQGVSGNGLKFNGYYNSGYVTIPNTQSLSFLDNYTFTIWFNIQNNTSMDGWGRVSEYGTQTLFAKAGDRNGLDLRTMRAADDGKLYLFAYSGWCCGSGPGGSLATADRFNLNEWHMATVSSGNGEVKLYLDCKLQGAMPTAQFSVNPSMQYRPLQLGIDQDAWWYPINGMLDETRVYNRALSDDEVRSLYLAGGIGPCPGENQLPVANAGPDKAAGCAGPQGSSVTLDGSGSTDPDGDALTYTWTWSGGSASGMNPAVTLPLGTTTVTLSVDDGKGGTAQDTVVITVQDTVPPVTNIQGIAGTAGTNGWYLSDVMVKLEATDNCSGVKEIRSLMDGIDTVVPGSVATVTSATDGTHSGGYFAVDNSGNSEASHPLTIKIDKTAPVIAAGVNPAPNARGWNNTDAVVTFTCTDAVSGIASCTAPITAVAEAAGQIVHGTAVDQAGNVAAASVVVNVDKTAPVTSAAVNGSYGTSCYSSDATVALSATDNLSGTTATSYRVNNGPWSSYAGLITLGADGAYVVGYGSQDNAGNSEIEKQITFTIDKKAPEAVIRFDAASKDIKVFNSETGAEASYIVLPSKHDHDDADDDDDDRDRGHHEKDGDDPEKDSEHHNDRHKEVRRYTLLDCANNTLLLTLLHKQEGHEAKVKVLGMQYNNAPAVKAPRNKMHAEYSAQKDGTIRELEQKIEVKKQFEVEAKYSGKKNETRIKSEVLGMKQVETDMGMVILELVTERGVLMYRK